jgi:hypothetical protein
MKSSAATVEAYLESLPAERRTALAAVRAVILRHLPAGYEEGMLWGMITYTIPLSRYPKTYNGQPLMYAALAAQKNHMSLYLTYAYMNPEAERWLRSAFAAHGKRLDMGKACLRFRRLDDLPLDVIGEAIAQATPEAYIARYEQSRK